MRIAYVANVRIPTEKAHGVQIMKMCEAFAFVGEEVELVLPTRRTHISTDPYEYYGVKKNFKITRLWCLDLVKFGYLGFLIETVSFALSVFFHTRKKKADVYYGRDELPLLFSSSPHFWEIHTAKFNFLVRAIIAKSRGVIAISQALENYLRKNGVTKKIIVAHDAVDLSVFSQKIPMRSRKVVLYVGHLYKHKGVDTLAEAAKFLPIDVNVRFIGGTDEEIKEFRAKYSGVKNIEIIGHKIYTQIPAEINLADVLVLPNSARDTRASMYTSPMKLFEYMASGVPIVASDVPALREVLDESMAILVKPDDPQALAAAITRLLADPSGSQRLVSSALQSVQSYTWDKRAERVLGFIRGI
ncbi:MAG TPA: glycosyltransferase family 4 protein [Candidatus Paceibacterota bacterium]